MACEYFKVPGGGVMIVCGARRRARRCQEPGCVAPSVCQCDNPVVQASLARSCDRYACAKHSVKIGKDRDLCLRHAGAAKAARVASRQQVPEMTAGGGSVLLWQNGAAVAQHHTIGQAAAQVGRLVTAPELATSRWEVSYATLFLAVEIMAPEPPKQARQRAKAR